MNAADSPAPPFANVLNSGAQNAFVGWRRVVGILICVGFVGWGGGGLANGLARLLPQDMSVVSAIHVPPAMTPPGGYPRNLLYTVTAQIESPAFITSVGAGLLSKGLLTSSELQAAKISAGVDRKTDLIHITVTHRSVQVALAIQRSLQQELTQVTLAQHGMTAMIVDPGAPVVAARSLLVVRIVTGAGAILSVLVMLLIVWRVERRRASNVAA